MGSPKSSGEIGARTKRDLNSKPFQARATASFAAPVALPSGMWAESKSMPWTVSRSTCSLLFKEPGGLPSNTKSPGMKASTELKPLKRSTPPGVSRKKYSEGLVSQNRNT